MKPLLFLLLLAAAEAAAGQPCDDVLRRAANLPEPPRALELLGGCLAARAEPAVHQRVALEMARISLRTGAHDDAARYLDLLRDMLEANDLPVSKRKGQ
jgi:hypothetical protein